MSRSFSASEADSRRRANSSPTAAPNLRAACSRNSRPFLRQAALHALRQAAFHSLFQAAFHALRDALAQPLGLPLLRPQVQRRHFVLLLEQAKSDAPDLLVIGGGKQPRHRRRQPRRHRGAEFAPHVPVGKHLREPVRHRLHPCRRLRRRVRTRGARTGVSRRYRSPWGGTVSAPRMGAKAKIRPRDVGNHPDYV